MTMETAKEALLSAFDRLFDRAASKLSVECSAEEKDGVKRHFIERYDEALSIFEDESVSAIPEEVMARMESGIDALTPAELAGYLAAAPLGREMQGMMHSIALRVAEKRLIEHLVNQADDTYGGN